MEKEEKSPDSESGKEFQSADNPVKKNYSEGFFTTSRFGRVHKPKTEADGFLRTECLAMSGTSAGKKTSPKKRKKKKLSLASGDNDKSSPGSLKNPPKMRELETSFQDNDSISENRPSLLDGLDNTLLDDDDDDIDDSVSEANAFVAEFDADSNETPTTEFLPGDLLWGRMVPYPFWPCIVLRDSASNSYYRSTNRKRLQYHVCFYGDNGKHCWLSSKFVFLFLGRENFISEVEQIEQKIRKEDVKKSGYFIKESLQAKWNKAVAEAEQVMTMTRDERVTSLYQSLPHNVPKRLSFGSSDLEEKLDDEIVNEKSVKTELETPPTVKRGRGRPRKYPKLEGPTGTPVKMPVGTPDTTPVGTPGETPLKRKRGRPLGSTKKAKMMRLASATEDDSTTPKNVNDSTTPKKVNDSTIPKKVKLGRPPKHAEEDDSITFKKVKLEKAPKSDFFTSKKGKLRRPEDYFMSKKLKLKRRELDNSTTFKKVKLEKSEGGFTEYCRTQMDTLKKQFPDKSDNEHKKFLLKMWKRLDDSKKDMFSKKSASTLKSSVIEEKEDDPVKEEENKSTAKDEDDDVDEGENTEVENEEEPPKKKINIFRGAKNERVCQVCEKLGKTVRCRGPCAGYFHVECAKGADNSEGTIHLLPEYEDKPKKRVRKKKIDKTLKQREKKSYSAAQSDSDSDLDYKGDSETIDVKADFMKIILGDVSEFPVVSMITADDSSESEDEAPSVEGKEVIGSFRCGDCAFLRTPLCFCCGLATDPTGEDSTRVRCSVAACGRHYHNECLKTWPQAVYGLSNGVLQKLTCPQHVCHTCVSDNPRECKGRFTQEKLVRCVRCPTAYHFGNLCIPAGTEILTSTQIICASHYEPPTKKGPTHLNVSWCFICSMGGSLICCDRCPASFHKECLKMEPPVGSYICEECETGRYPLYNEILWVKLGTYRWWPARSLFPSEVPERIMKSPHSLGEFVVHFLGTKSYYWIQRGRCFLYHEGDSVHKAGKSQMDADFNNGLAEASKLHAELKAKQESQGKIMKMKPPQYQKIKANKPVGNVKTYELDSSNTAACECDPDSEHPCSPDSDCLNRILLVECDPNICPAGSRCENQCFEKRIYPDLEPYHTDSRGWGLRTKVDIKKGMFVIEYVGEVIDDEEYRSRLQKKHEQKDENYYFLTIDSNRMIDAGPKGNLSRFMNHSCQPNCETQKWTVAGDTRVGLFTSMDVPANTELTFNYNLESDGNEKKPCKCGAVNCSGFIGAKLIKSIVEEIKSLPLSKKKRGRKSKKSLADEACLMCNAGSNLGRMLTCSNKECMARYHLHCVALDVAPAVRWFCGRHRCNSCSKRSPYWCTFCTDSYCMLHIDNNMTNHQVHGFLCTSHGKTHNDDDPDRSLQEKKEEKLRLVAEERLREEERRKREELERTQRRDRRASMPPRLKKTVIRKKKKRAVQEGISGETSGEEVSGQSTADETTTETETTADQTEEETFFDDDKCKESSPFEIEDSESEKNKPHEEKKMDKINNVDAKDEDEIETNDDVDTATEGNEEKSQQSTTKEEVPAASDLNISSQSSKDVSLADEVSINQETTMESEPARETGVKEEVDQNRAVSSASSDMPSLHVDDDEADTREDKTLEPDSTSDKIISIANSVGDDLPAQDCTVSEVDSKPKDSTVPDADSKPEDPTAPDADTKPEDSTLPDADPKPDSTVPDTNFKPKEPPAKEKRRYSRRSKVDRRKNVTKKVTPTLEKVHKDNHFDRAGLGDELDRVANSFASDESQEGETGGQTGANNTAERLVEDSLPNQDEECRIGSPDLLSSADLLARQISKGLKVMPPNRRLSSARARTSQISISEELIEKVERTGNGLRILKGRSSSTEPNANGILRTENISGDGLQGSLNRKTVRPVLSKVQDNGVEGVEMKPSGNNTLPAQKPSHPRTQRKKPVVKVVEKKQSTDGQFCTLWNQDLLTDILQ